MRGKIKGCGPVMVLGNHARKRSSTLARAVRLQTDLPRESGKQMLEIDMLMGGYSSEQRPQRLYPGEQWESLTPEGRTQKPGEIQVLDTQWKETVGKQEENSIPPPRFYNQLHGWLTSCGQTHSFGNSVELGFDYAVFDV